MNMGNRKPTVIRLFSCWKCGKIKDERDASNPAGCRCGSRMVREAAPTKKNIFKYFLSHPSMLLVWAKEKVC